jgi:hypothetical protein
MNNSAARTIIDAELATYRERSYAELVAVTGQEPFRTEISRDGVTYQVEIVVVWDAQPGGAVRVLGSIDDGGWRAFVPLTADFIMAPDGSFVGES